MFGAYDLLRRRVVFAGGLRAGGKDVEQAMWSWDGTAWTRAGALPAPRFASGLTSDGQQLVLTCGGNQDKRAVADLWVWSPETAPDAPAPRDWRPAFVPEGVEPRSRVGFVHAPDRGRFLFATGSLPGSRVAGDLWAWLGEGAGWVSLPSDLPARHSAAIAYDARERRLVLFGGGVGSDFLGDLWTWRDEQEGWVEGSTRAGSGPGPRSEASMVFDGTRCLLFGGRVGVRGSDRCTNELWALEGDAWTQLRLDPAPPPRCFAAFVWDPARRVAVLHGGAADAGKRDDLHDDVWELHPPG